MKDLEDPKKGMKLEIVVDGCDVSIKAAGSTRGIMAATATVLAEISKKIKFLGSPLEVEKAIHRAAKSALKAEEEES